MKARAVTHQDGELHGFSTYPFHSKAKSSCIIFPSSAHPPQLSHTELSSSQHTPAHLHQLQLTLHYSLLSERGMWKDGERRKRIWNAVSGQTHRSRRLQIHFFYLTHIRWFRQSYRHQEFTQFKIKESKIKEFTPRGFSNPCQRAREVFLCSIQLLQQSHQELLPLSGEPLNVSDTIPHSLRAIPLLWPYLLPLAVGGEFLGRNEEAESEDGFEFGRQPLRLKVLKLRLPLPKHRHVQTEAEHLSEPQTQLPRSLRPARKGSKTERFPWANFSS